MHENTVAYKTGYEIMIQKAPGNPDLARDYGIVSEFLWQNPDMQASKKQEPVTMEYLVKHAPGFARGREKKGPKMPKTKSDDRIRDILQYAYSVPAEKLDEAICFHREAMGAENFIGWMLEAYIASHAGQTGWTWCSGSMIRAVDFIKPMGEGNWRMLQIKNRSNSENSSSSRVRLGTSIEKWFRVYAKNGRTNWGEFPDIELRANLSEDGFRHYIIDWLRRNAQKRQ